MTGWERNAVMGWKTRMQVPPQVVRTGREVVNRWTGRHDQESSEAYLPKGTQALSWPYLDLGSLLRCVPLGHSRSAFLAISARVCVREVVW
jgi:hypothetical protein